MSELPRLDLMFKRSLEMIVAGGLLEVPVAMVSAAWFASSIVLYVKNVSPSNLLIHTRMRSCRLTTRRLVCITTLVLLSAVLG